MLGLPGSEVGDRLLVAMNSKPALRLIFDDVAGNNVGGGNLASISVSDLEIGCEPPISGVSLRRYQAAIGFERSAQELFAVVPGMGVNSAKGCA